MEIIGDDKKLRALFNEAQRADQAASPGFTSMWHRAQARSTKPRRAFRLSFAVVTALLLLTLGSLAAWSMYSLRRNQQHEAVKNAPAPKSAIPVNTPNEPKTNDGVNIAQQAPPAPMETPVRRRSPKPRALRPAAPGDGQLLAKNETAKETTIDTWQSPTAGLLSSPMDGLLKSVPQLNENTNEMKSVLPGRSNDKEK
ncbi:MAG TPA: hypothetical protein VE961_01630 [Pyrinomonadaceae bacterium]|nr:hypothetical protein [Pyrinomonadaceae bacterium]